MDETPDKPRPVLAAGMIFFGLLGALAGYALFVLRDQLPLGTLVYFALSFLAGATLVGSGIVLLFRRPATIRWLAFAAASVLFLNQTVGVWLNTLLCQTPG